VFFDRGRTKNGVTNSCVGNVMKPEILNLAPTTVLVYGYVTKRQRIINCQHFPAYRFHRQRTGKTSNLYVATCGERYGMTQTHRRMGDRGSVRKELMCSAGRIKGTSGLEYNVRERTTILRVR
tara:strand:+ start:499 stop:867 length:369 start_codon:yes stop_codon:yes gene_type:complete